MMTELSIIVPVYNAAGYLMRCVDSILTQSWCDFEILLIENGSTDGSLKMCEEFAEADDRIRVLTMENRGVSAARNLGLDNARGQWITFIDADDWIEPDTFDTIYADIDYTDVDIIVFDITHHYEKSGTERAEYSYPESFDISDKKKIRNLALRVLAPFWFRIDGSYCSMFGGSCCNKWFRADLLGKEIRFSEDLRRLEDNRFVLQAFSRCSSLHYIHELFYNYRRAGSTACGSFSEKDPATFGQYLQFSGNWIEQYYPGDELAEQAYNARAFDCMETLMLNYFCHPEKYTPVLETILQVEQTFSEKPYSDVLNNIKSSCLPRSRKIPVRLLQHQQWGLVYIFYSIKRSLSQRK